MKYYDEENKRLFDTIEEYNTFQEEQEKKRLKKETLEAEKELREDAIKECVCEINRLQNKLLELRADYNRDYPTDHIGITVEFPLINLDTLDVGELIHSIFKYININ